MLRPGTQDTLISRRENMPTAKSHAELVSEVEPKIKAQAFFSARVSEAHILDRLREVSDGYSRGEFGLGEARNRLKDFLRAEGYDPHQGGMRNLASTGRLNLILKQNAAMAHAAAEWKRMHDPDAMKVYPYVRYHARSDSRTRSEHAHLDGRIFRKDDPFLSTHTPPWEFNCRCWLEEITEKEAGKTPDLIQEPTPADKVTVDSKSGFSFDPAHAFEKFDLTSIKNEARREDVAEQFVNRFGVEVSPDGETASIVSTDTAKFEKLSRKFGEEVQEAITGLEKSEHIETVDFSYMPKEAAEKTREAADRIVKRVEEYGLDISYVGTRYHSTKRKLNPKILLETREKDGRTEFIFNDELLAAPNLVSKMKDAANSGYHPKGFDSIAAYVDHDIAHLLFYQAKMDQDAKFMAFIRFLRKRPEFVREHISGYAEYFAILSEKDEEFAQEALAECWASAQNTEDPPLLHKILANALEKRLKRK